MKYIGIVMLVLGFQMSFAQTDAVDVRKLTTGELTITGTDPFGAQVTVTYDRNRVKVYQERTLNGETTYAFFSNGEVTEYGTVVRPGLMTNVELEETDKP